MHLSESDHKGYSVNPLILQNLIQTKYNKKSPLVIKQDGFYIFIKSDYSLPAIASLMLSLGTICSLNE